MIEKYDELYEDFEAVRKIPIVPTMLDVICRATGMGFAAVARVTDNRWLACSVLDGVKFGLAAGDELKIETTICNEIKDSRRPVVIDHVALDPHFQHHHTPKMYGLQSYISYPIILKNGDFFGTLCAIDSKPAQLNNPQILGTFSLFAELLSFHLQSLLLIERSQTALQETSRQLNYSTDENLLYRQIASHNLQEPLRKIRLYSNLLETKADDADLAHAKKLAGKINSLARELSGMIEHITDFSELSNNHTALEPVDLAIVLQEVASLLQPKLASKNIQVSGGALPVIAAIPLQMTQLFFHIINYIVTFSRKNAPTPIRISANSITPNKVALPDFSAGEQAFVEITIEKDNIDFEGQDIEHVFDFFVHLNEQEADEKYGAGLAYCRKIIHNHAGVITAQPAAANGIAFSIVLPIGGN